MLFHIPFIVLFHTAIASAIDDTYLPPNTGKYFFIDVENTGNKQDDFADFMSYNAIPALISNDEI